MCGRTKTGVPKDGKRDATYETQTISLVEVNDDHQAFRHNKLCAGAVLTETAPEAGGLGKCNQVGETLRMLQFRAFSARGADYTCLIFQRNLSFRFVYCGWERHEKRGREDFGNQHALPTENEEPSTRPESWS